MKFLKTILFILISALGISLLFSIVLPKGIPLKFYLPVSIDRKILRTDISHDYISPIVTAARNQIGVVTKYDGTYYVGGYPPEDRGVCSDVISRALRDSGYNLKEKLDSDMKKHPERYTREYDPHINFRRVVNIEDYLDTHAQSLSPNPPTDNDWSDWLPGDIVTYEQIPGQLWHIAIISDYASHNGTPLIIHNYGVGTQENDMLLTWPSNLVKRYRINL
jgi:uncharacterized protein YijF (DUF1287 family)